MALISPDEFKSSKGKKKKQSQGGLISPSDFKASKAETAEVKKVEEKEASNIVNKVRASTIMEPIDLIGAVDRLPKEDPFVSSFKTSAERLVEEHPKKNILLDVAKSAIGQGKRNIESLTEGRETVLGSPLAPRKALPIPDRDSSLADRAKFIAKIIPRMATDPIAEIGAEVYMPGAGAMNVANFAGSVGSKLSRIAPKLEKTRAGRIAKDVIEGAVTSAPIEFGYAAKTAEDNKELLKQTAKGTALGAGLGGALRGGGEILDILKTAKQSPKALVDKEIKEFIKRTQEPEVPKGIFPEPVPAEAVKQGWFERLFGTQGVGITPQIADGRRNILSTEGQIVDDPLKQTISGLVGTTKAATRRVYQNVFDELDPIKKISKEAYDASMDANRSNQLANVIVTDKFVNPQGEVIGEGLQGIVRKSGRGNYNAFTDYLIARHAVTRTARGERVYAENLGMTTEKIAERVKYLEDRNPGFKEIGQEWDNYYKNIRQVYGVEEGLIPKSLADVLEEQNPNYAPMKRQFTTEERIKGLRSGGVKPMFSGQKAPIQKVSPTGSTRKVVDPVRSTIEQTGAWVNAAMRNRTMVKIVDAVTADIDGMKEIVEIIQPPKGQPNLREVLETEGEERFLEMLQEDFNKIFSKSALDKDNVVRAMVKGEPVYMRIYDPEAVKALSSMGSEQAGITLAIFRGISNTVKRGATGALAPVFAAKSVSVDLLGALVQSENAIKHSGYLVGSVFSSIGDVLKIPGLRNMAQDFYQAGGGYSAALRGERGLKKGVSKMRLDPILSPRTIAKGVGRTLASPFKLSTGIADISENLNRIAAFNYKIRQLGERTPDNVQEAMNYAREITTNYSRKGAWARSLEATFPYQNAAVQGLYRFAKAWKKNPIKTAAGVGSLVILPKLYEYAMFADDKDYQDLPARERYRNIIIGKNDDGSFRKIPAPPEYAGIGALMVDMLRAHKDGDPEAFKGTSDAIMNAYTPPAISGALQGITQGGGIEQSLAGAVTSTSVGPVLGTFANQSFTGAPIESMRVSDRSPGQRYDERTSIVAKYLGDKLNYSPMKIDYLLRSYGGDPARLGLPLTSDVGAGTARNTLARAWIVDPVFTNTLTDDYYRGKEALTQAYRDSQEVDAELPEWYDDGLRKYISSTAKGAVSKRLSNLASEKRSVNTDKSLTAEQKSQELRNIQREMNEIYVEVNTRLKEAGVPILNR